MVVISINVISQLCPTPKGWIAVDGRKFEKEVDSSFYSKNGFVRYAKEGSYRFTSINDLSFESKNYEELTNFNNGIAMAKIEGKWWVIDTLENKVKQIACHYAYEFHEGLARIQLGNRFGYVNEKGEIVIPVKYFGAHDFNEGRARVYLNKKWGVINKQGQWVVKPSFDFIWDYSEGKASVMKKEGHEEKWGYINKDGVVVVNLKYGYVFPFSEGKALIRMADYFSNDLRFISESEEVLFKVPYVDIYPFEEGMACFFKDGKWGYMNKQFEVLIEAKFDKPANFLYGLAFVHIDGKPMYIDQSGSIIWQ